MTLATSAAVVGGAGRSMQFASKLFAAPAVAACLLLVIVPLLMVFARAVYNADVAQAFPATCNALDQWQEGEPITAQTRSALVDDLKTSYTARTLPAAAQRLNQQARGTRSMIIASGRSVARAEPGSAAEAALPADWQKPELWAALSTACSPIDLSNFSRIFSAVEGAADATPQRVYLELLWRTVAISLAVTGLCILIGYPMAYALTAARANVARLLFFLAFLPLWMSLLARSAAWVIILQKGGTLDSLAQLLARPLDILYTRPAVYIAMTHVMLPFLVYPLYTAMKNLQKNQMSAALSLGSSAGRAFWLVFVPQTMGGLAAGATLVYVISMGFYLTPALVGGAFDQMVSYSISELALGIGDTGFASTLAVALIALMLGGVVAINLCARALRHALTRLS